MKNNNQDIKIFNTNNIDIVKHFTFGEILIKRINLLLKSFIDSKIIFVSSDNSLKFLCSIINEFYELLYGILNFEINPQLLSMIQNYNNSINTIQKKDIVKELGLLNEYFYKLYPHLKNGSQINILANIYLKSIESSILHDFTSMLNKDKNSSRAKLKNNDIQLLRYRQVIEENSNGKSVYKSCIDIAKKNNLDPQNFTADFKSWAKYNNIKLIKHR